MSEAAYSCSWCEWLNRAEDETCANCGHDAHRPRMLCECWQCAGIPAGHDQLPEEGEGR